MFENKTRRFVTGFIVGSLTGTAVGLLFAPRTGRETRRVVKYKTGRHAGALRGRFGKANYGRRVGQRTDSQAAVAR